MAVYEGRKGLKELTKKAHKGMKIYVIYTNHGHRLGASFESYSEYVLDRRSSLTGAWMTAGGTTIQALLGVGPVHDERPRRMATFDGPHVQGTDFNIVPAGSWNDQLAWTEKEARLATERRERGF